MPGKVKVGIIGSQFEADIHAASFQIMPDEAEVVAVASPTPGHPEELARKYGIPRVFHDYREMIDVCHRQGVLLMYAEELFFTPKYVQAKRMADEGAFGKVYMVKQSEKH